MKLFPGTRRVFMHKMRIVYSPSDSFQKSYHNGICRNEMTIQKQTSINPIIWKEQELLYESEKKTRQKDRRDRRVRRHKEKRKIETG